MSFYIKNLKIEGNVVLGPMAGNTNYAYRKIAKEHGCGLVYAEMVSDKGLNFKNHKTRTMINVYEDEHPVSMQIFGSTVEDMVVAAKYIDENSNCDIIDINMGCPVNKVAKKSQAGSALMQYPDLVYEIVKGVVESVKKPVTVKIRSGWDSNHINAVEIAKLIEKAGASAIAIHGRTRAQMYSGNADWKIIKEVKEAVTIPVIGNGDIKNAFDAKRMMDETGCDGVMIARGAQGNPWIFRDAIALWKGEEKPPAPTVEEKIAMMIRHLEDVAAHKSEYAAVREMRKHVGWYLKGEHGSAAIRRKVNTITDIQELKRELENMMK